MSTTELVKLSAAEMAAKIKAKEVSKEPNTETNSEIKDKKGKDEK